jgi:hypothetical protein
MNSVGTEYGLILELFCECGDKIPSDFIKAKHFLTYDIKLFDCTLVKILGFWNVSIVLFLFKRQNFGDWILSPSSGKTYVVLNKKQDDG